MSVESWFIDYLNGELTAPVSGCVPHPMPGEFVTVELTGSNRADQILHATLTVESWSTTRAAACALHNLVDAAMRASVSENEVSRCELEAGYNDTDQETHRPRYHARYGIVYLGG